MRKKKLFQKTSIEAHSWAISSMQWDADLNLLFTGSIDGTIGVLRFESGDSLKHSIYRKPVGRKVNSIVLLDGSTGLLAVGGTANSSGDCNIQIMRV